jgi:hypothetical protein
MALIVAGANKSMTEEDAKRFSKLISGNQTSNRYLYRTFGLKEPVHPSLSLVGEAFRASQFKARNLVGCMTG